MTDRLQGDRRTSGKVTDRCEDDRQTGNDRQVGYDGTVKIKGVVLGCTYWL